MQPGNKLPHYRLCYESCYQALRQAKHYTTENCTRSFLMGDLGAYHPKPESYRNKTYQFTTTLAILLTVERLIKDNPNKGYNTFNLSIKDRHCGPYQAMEIHFYL